jgi:hypothetical protein
MLARILIPAVFLVLTACAAAMPGYSPPPFKEKSKMATPLESGDVRLGRQLRDERQREGHGLQAPHRLDADRHGAPERPLRAHGALGGCAGAQKTVAPVYGGSALTADRQAVYARERAKLEAYNAELAAKGCATLDIDAELARAPDPPGKKY